MPPAKAVPAVSVHDTVTSRSFCPVITTVTSVLLPGVPVASDAVVSTTVITLRSSGEIVATPSPSVTVATPPEVSVHVTLNVSTASATLSLTSVTSKDCTPSWPGVYVTGKVAST